MYHRAPAPKTRGDHYLSIKDSESLDIYIQNTLSSLYPPFEATAATVLWQLFSIVEKLYRGDGLRCLIDFLVPAKRALQCIQQETCAKYTGLIFYHEGWPLCIHEKVVVQLASVHKVRLKPGDFYFQIISAGKQSVKLVLKCLSRHGRGIEEITVPETILGKLDSDGQLFAGMKSHKCHKEDEDYPHNSAVTDAKSSFQVLETFATNYQTNHLTSTKNYCSLESYLCVEAETVVGEQWYKSVQGTPFG
ncbi:hypothetical protein Y1Q_0022668 [Alligator mississippiensis]|uniref:Uncharacterized protein n=1 Tax=Alligator mississippiensis TaxID=8496 RepID=A0A151PHJ0_ALLMI|nr:hypothetical protein Y1Q_0022668 [Alligator mississippiensis]